MKGLTDHDTPSGIMHKLFFTSASRIMSKKNPLELSDLWTIPQSASAEHIDSIFSKNWEKEKTGKNPSLFFALIKTFKTDLILGLSFQLLWGIFLFGLPAMIPYMIEYLTDPTVATAWGYGYALIAAFLSLFSSLFLYQAKWKAELMGIKVKTALMTAIYNKVLLSPKFSDISPGKVANLFSSDTYLFFLGSSWLLPGYLSVLVLIGSVVMMAFSIGIYSLVSVVVMVILIPLGLKLGFRIEWFRTKLQREADKRLRISREMIEGIRIVKYHAWEEPFLKRIEDFRGTELHYLRSLARVRTLTISFSRVMPVLVLGCTMLFLGLFSTNITASVIFTVVAVVNLTRIPFSWLSASSLISFLLRSALYRIQDYLLMPEIVEYVEHVGKRIRIKKGEFMWPNAEGATLSDIDIDIKPKELSMVVGAVGAGKTSLILALLNEIPKIKGSVEVGGKMAYVPQEAWIFSATVRENILVGKEYDEKKYKRIIYSTALTHDFDQFPSGDLTEIGERGINLSGGQKQRISIARAIYANADLYVLDDPFSAVDSHVAKHLYEIALLKELKHKTVLLVTNSLQYLPFAKNVIFLRNGIMNDTQQRLCHVNSVLGKIEAQGQFTELHKKCTPFRTLMKKYGVLEKTSSSRKIHKDKKIQSDKYKVSRSSSRTKKDGKSKDRSDNPEIGELSIKTVKSSNDGTNEGDDVEDEDAITKGKLVHAEEKQVGLVSAEIYQYYIKTGGYMRFAMIVVALLISGAIRVLATWWLQRWVDDANLAVPEREGSYWAWTFLGFTFAELLVIVIYNYIALVLFALRSSKKLHYRIIHNLSYALTGFFDSTPIGRILNRLSNDLSQIDFTLSVMFVLWLNSMNFVVSSFAGIGLGSWKIFLALIPLAIIYYALQVYFRAANIQVQRLDAVTRASPLSHINATINGLDSIRGYQYNEQFIKRSNILLDTNSVAKYAIRLGGTWFAMRLDFLSFFTILFVFMGVVISRETVVPAQPAYSHSDRDSIDPGFAGIAMSSSAGVAALLTYFSVSSTEVEMRLNAVERFKEYEDIPVETPASPSDIIPPSTWPSKGKLQFNHLTFKYELGPPVLHDLTFVVPGGAKVGIVGRTGAGKSSIMQALFRVREPSNGTILIDGIDYTKVGLQKLRSSLSIIPQDPTLFLGTLRYNLDPFDTHSDARLWEVLEIVQLKSYIETLDGKLNAEVEEGGSNFSVGQRQLLCMGRSLIRDSKILLLDEATASVDVNTDNLVQKTLRTAFKNCTVLTIAHRLNTIMDSDIILVLDKGKVLQFGPPWELIKQKGLFKSLVRDTGSSSARYLTDIAMVKKKQSLREATLSKK